MKYKTLQLFIGFALLTGSTNAQNLIAVQNGGGPEFYTNLEVAVIQATDGDTLYLSGGYFYLNSDLEITKQLHIIGAGHNPDSALTTLPTYIKNNNIRLRTGASGGSLCGVYLDNYLMFNETVNNFLIFRCNINTINIYTNTASNNIFTENIFNTLNLYNASYLLFYNNIIMGKVSWIGEFSIFKNNIFLTTNVTIGYSKSSTFENNIIISQLWLFETEPGTYNVFNNNLFCAEVSFPITVNGCTLYGSGNIVDQLQDSIFISQSWSSFNYSNDYHLQPTCPGKNAGTDGTDVGIYGGPFPWKEGSLPVNPHIQHKYIDGATDQNGNLNVNIKVSAQDH